MIYPTEFPSNVNNQGEEVVFERLKKLANQYDIFYARRFIALSVQEKPEYEIDFIIADPNRAVLCLEVKGGILTYNGANNQWQQSGKLLEKSPDSQASSAMHSLIQRFPQLASEVPFGWALCLAECELVYGTPLPPNLSESQIIDQNGLLFIEKSIEVVFKALKAQYPNKQGVKPWVYERFKNDLLRNLGVVQVLGTRMKYDEERFFELTQQQIDLFNRIAENNQILVQGPAGSGKTIIAKTFAQIQAEEGKQVLLTCYNRTLANQLTYETGLRDNERIQVQSFHSLAKRTIERFDAEWWESASKESDFWELDLPAKLDQVPVEQCPIFDILIIDEGQDFKEFWFEVLFKFVRPEGKIIVFADQMQDIFQREGQIPNEKYFMKLKLDENCRNTKRIVKYLSEVVKSDIKTFSRNPEGDDIVYRVCKNEIDQQTQIITDIQQLIREHRIRTDQILILLNSDKATSCLSNTSKVGSFALKALDNKARFESNTIHYTQIDTFKGLEADIVFIADIQKISPTHLVQRLYTEASRAKHKLYIFKNY